MPTNILDPKQALTQVRPVLEDMPVDQVKEPVFPPANMVGEANALYLVADRHRAQLTKLGLDAKLIDDLPLRAQALAGAQAARALVPDTKRSSEELAAEEEAYVLRQDLMAAGRFALRADAQAQSTLDAINEGTGFDDLIQDLKALALFCDNYATQLKSVGVELPAQSKKAVDLAARFEAHLAERRTASDEERAATDLRNRAATHLWNAMAEIRAAGVYAFRNDPSVLPLFRSAYRRRHRGTGKVADSGGTPPTNG